MLSKKSLAERMRPEIGAGGFSHRDGTVEFYSRVNALLRPNMTVLDLGAGRGLFLEGNSLYRRDLQTLQGKVKELIGVDVDPAIEQHPALDRRYVVLVSAPLPLADNSVDLIVSDWVFEHIAEPSALVTEIERVLKPGGWICARTNNKWGMIGLVARAIPNRLHVSALKRLQPGRKDVDVFPVTYKMNTPSAIRTLFKPARWLDYSYFWNGDPAYYAESRILWILTEFLFRLLPKSLSASYFIFLQRRNSGNG
ncbi:MAG: methyltransferase domain-containing protein [Rhizomicrobium sp.]